MDAAVALPTLTKAAEAAGKWGSYPWSADYACSATTLPVDRVTTPPNLSTKSTVPAHLKDFLPYSNLALAHYAS